MRSPVVCAPDEGIPHRGHRLHRRSRRPQAARREATTCARSSARPRRRAELGRSAASWSSATSATTPRSPTGLEGCDAVIHGAAVYEVGIPGVEHRAMYEANVLGTERVLRAALDAKTPRVVYVSTVAAFGNTHGEVVDETYEHPGREFTSYYEQTKYEAHRIAQAPDRRRGPAVRDRAAGRGLRSRRPLGDRHVDPSVPRRQDADDRLPGARDEHGPCRGRRRRHPAGARPRRARGVLRARRPDHDDARADRRRSAGSPTASRPPARCPPGR